MRSANLRWITLLARLLIDAAMFLSNMCLAAMLALVFLNVVLRYVFTQPLYWGDEIMTYLMILLAFMGFGYNLMEDRHIKMTALVERLPARAQDIVRVLTSLLSIGYFVFLVVAGAYVTIDSFQIGYFSMVTRLPIGPWQLLMCVGLAVLLVASILVTINRIRMVCGFHEKPQIKDH